LGVRLLSGQTEKSGDLAEEVNRLSIEIGVPALRLAVLAAPAWAFFVLGRLNEALALAEEGIALGAEDPMLGGGLGSFACPFVWCFMMKGLLLCFMGRLDESASAFESARLVAQERGDLEVQGLAHQGNGWLARYTGQPEAMLAHASQAYEVAERVGSPYARVWSLLLRGYAHLMLGDTAEAIGAIERGLELAREARTGLEFEAWWVAALSEALLSAGDHLRAREVAEESVALGLQRCNEAHLPTCYRVLAEVLLASEDPGRLAAAQEALEKAIAAAEATGARAELPLIERAREKLMAVS
jgi:adenylate cyclase